MEKQDYIETEKAMEYLACVLTDQELIEKSKELAKANEDLETAEDRKKDLMADITATIKKHEANIGQLARIVSQGKEYREIKCEWEINYTRGIKTLYRQDTGEIVKTGTVTQKDRQAPL